MDNASNVQKLESEMRELLITLDNKALGELKAELDATAAEIETRYGGNSK